MRDYFEGLCAALDAALMGDEIYLANFAAEDSDFVRLNGARVRQAGHVAQTRLAIRLVSGERHASLSLALSGNRADDLKRVTDGVARLRETLPHVAPDPYFLYNDVVTSTDASATNELPDAASMLADVLAQSAGVDLVGFLATGGIYTGFANSLGQRNWHASYSVNFDWSLHLRADRAVKAAYAGPRWDSSQVEKVLSRSRRELELLDNPAQTLKPGAYRAYLAPAALLEVMELLAWGGFGCKQQRTRQSPLMRLVDGNEQLHPSVHLAEDTAGGIAPAFQSAGFARPESVPLVESGQFANPLISPRSAREYGEQTNGAGDAEAPQSLSMQGGTVADDDVLRMLDTGLYINNLWYLNYSDRPACRITGMTRFAAFWVERGEIVAPVNVMRFDDSVYRLLGDHLDALTAEPETILSTSTYDARSTQSVRLPGAFVNEFRLTL